MTGCAAGKSFFITNQNAHSALMGAEIWNNQGGIMRVITNDGNKRMRNYNDKFLAA